jgi:hypothetical protein
LTVFAVAPPGDLLIPEGSPGLPAYSCQVQVVGKSTPWIATFSPVSGDITPPVVQVQVAPSLVEESVWAAGLPVVVRSNEPARARVELIAENGARHGLLARTLKWANRDYPLIVRLNRAGLRARDVGSLYRLRVQVTDRRGNRAQTIERHGCIANSPGPAARARNSTSNL